MPPASPPATPLHLRVLVVDDNLRFAAALKDILSGWNGVQVLAMVHDGHAALVCAGQSRPDLVLLDIAMPGLDGLEVARRLCAWPEPPRIVLMSLSEGAVYRAAASALGNVGFVDKGDILAELTPLVARLVADKTRACGPPGQCAPT